VLVRVMCSDQLVRGSLVEPLPLLFAVPTTPLHSLAHSSCSTRLQATKGEKHEETTDYYDTDRNRNRPPTRRYETEVYVPIEESLKRETTGKAAFPKKALSVCALGHSSFAPTRSTVVVVNQAGEKKAARRHDFFFFFTVSFRSLVGWVGSGHAFHIGGGGGGGGGVGSLFPGGTELFQ